jgi:UDP-N-acetylmuramoyl-L-alanyl-D-glutamate--2,6-diaminopimelate ligase
VITQNIFPKKYPVTCHTDTLLQGGTFIAIKGMKEEGVSYISKALAQGAQTIVIENNVVISDELQRELHHYNAQIKRVDNARRALAQLSAEALGFPARKLKIIGITGTKGKTTTTFLLEHMLQQAGYKTALLSTVNNRILTTNLPTQLTTQQPDYLHVFFDQCVKNGVEFVIMEIAAQGLSLHRIEGINLDGVIFTNFSQEHAEFYPTIDDYFAAKKQIIDHIKPGAPLFLNADDPRIGALKSNSPTYHFSISDHAARTRGRLLSSGLKGLSLEMSMGEHTMIGYAPALMGNFNVSNIMAASVCAQYLGLSEMQIVEGLKTFEGVPGRLNRYTLPNEALAFIDYAHNPSSFEAVLSALRPLTPHLIVLFGAGGDRDATKRPIMGQIATRIADKVILTSDNPRSEDPEEITRQIEAGIPLSEKHKVIKELDRERAIHHAYKISHAKSVLVLLGKGPDEYQLVKGVKTYFSEATILKSLK